MRAAAWAASLLLATSACSGSDAPDRDRPAGRTVAQLAQLDGYGLLSSKDGLALAPGKRILPLGRQVMTFTLLDAEDLPLRDYLARDGAPMHVYLARADTTRFVHAHPTLTPDGSWSMPVTIEAPGPYRVFTLFQPAGGAPTVLSASLTAPGPYQAEPVPGPADLATAGGLTATLARAGDTLAFRVTAAAGPVRDLRGAELVVLHEGDLALRQQVLGSPGPDLRFRAVLDKPGAWRAFLHLRRGTAVVVLPFTVAVPAAD